MEATIERIQQSPELWMSNHKLYRRKPLVHQTWVKVANELGLDVTTAKKRWRNLKDQYRKELRKIVAANGGVWPEVESSPWPYFELMTFMKEEILAAKPIGNVSRTANSDEDMSVESEVESKSRKHKIESPQKSTKRKKINSSHSKMTEVLKSIHWLMKKVDSRTEESHSGLMNDSDYLYLISLLPTIKQLSQRQNLEFRGKLNDWLLSALTEQELSDPIDDTKVFIGH